MSIERNRTLLDYFAANAPPVPDWYHGWFNSPIMKRSPPPDITTPLPPLAEAVYECDKLESHTQELISWRWYYAQKMYERREEEHLFLEKVT